MSTTWHPNLGKSVCRGTLALAIFVCGTTVSLAQQPPLPRPTAPKPSAKSVPKPPTPEEKALALERARIKGVLLEINKLRNKVSPIARAGVIPAADQPEVDQFFTHFLDVLTSPAGPLEYSECRSKLRAEVRTFGNAPDKSGLAFVNNMLLTKMEEVVWSQPAEKFSPHARYNCMLAIGELNEQEPNLGGSGTVKPYAPALPSLVKTVATPDAPASVRVAALVGIQRHAKLGIDDKNVEKQAVVELAKLIQQPTPPADTSADGHHWMRRQAIEVLNLLKQPGPANEAIAALSGIVTEKDNPMQVRLDALRALGQLKLPANALGDAAVVPTVGGLTLEVLKEVPNRRALRLNFQSLLIGLKGQPPQAGVLATASGPDKKRAEELSQKIAKYAEFVEKITDVTTIGMQIPIEAANFEIWLAEEPEVAP